MGGPVSEAVETMSIVACDARSDAAVLWMVGE